MVGCCVGSVFQGCYILKGKATDLSTGYSQFCELGVASAVSTSLLRHADVCDATVSRQLHASYAVTCCAASIRTHGPPLPTVPDLNSFTLRHSSGYRVATACRCSLDIWRCPRVPHG